MTNTEYIKRSGELKSQLKALEAEFLAQSHIQKGDKVLVKMLDHKGGTIETVCYVNQVKEPDFLFANDPDKVNYRFELSKFKKDGTPSQNSFYHYGATSIEKL